MTRPLQVRRPRAPETTPGMGWTIFGAVVVIVFAGSVVVYAFWRWFDVGTGITG